MPAGDYFFAARAAAAAAADVRLDRRSEDRVREGDRVLGVVRAGALRVDLVGLVTVGRERVGGRGTVTVRAVGRVTVGRGALTVGRVKVGRVRMR